MFNWLDPAIYTCNSYHPQTVGCVKKNTWEPVLCALCYVFSETRAPFSPGNFLHFDKFLNICLICTLNRTKMSESGSISDSEDNHPMVSGKRKNHMESFTQPTRFFLSLSLHLLEGAGTKQHKCYCSEPRASAGTTRAGQ